MSGVSGVRDRGGPAGVDTTNELATGSTEKLAVGLTLAELAALVVTARAWIRQLNASANTAATAIGVHADANGVTPVAGFGVAVSMQADNAAAAIKEAARVSAVWATATAAAEVAALTVRLMSAGTLQAVGAEALSLGVATTNLRAGTSIILTADGTPLTLSNQRLAGNNGMIAQFSRFSSQAASYIEFLSLLADGATAIGHRFGNFPALTVEGAKIASFYNDFYATERAYIDKNGGAGFGGRIRGAKGADLVVGGTTTLTLGNGNLFSVATGGGATVSHITTTDWTAGSQVVLAFTGAVTVTHNAGSPPANTAAVFLKSGANLSAVANTTLTLMYTGSLWMEI